MPLRPTEKMVPTTVKNENKGLTKHIKKAI